MMQPDSMFLFASLSTWLTPVWLLGMGALLGLIGVAALVGLTFLVSRKAGKWVLETITESALLPVFYTAFAIGGFALLITFMVPAGPLKDSALQLASTGQAAEKTLTVEPAAIQQILELGVAASTLKTVEITADKPVTVLTAPALNLLETYREEVSPHTPFIWERGRTAKQIFGGTEGQFAVTNPSGEPVQLTVNAFTEAQYPETRIIPQTALALVLLVVAYLLFKRLAPKISAIALATAKEAMSQPIFYVAMAIGVFYLLISVFIPYNTFGDDVKMVKENSITLIMLLAMLVAIWTASVSVADEIEGRTALTVLSKPVGRRQFILGKFAGIVMAAATMFIILGTLFMATVSYKVVYDARENSRQIESADMPASGYAERTVTWRECQLEMTEVVPGLVLGFFATVVMTSISVAISTRLPMLPNLIICASIYVLGNLVPQISKSTVGEFEAVHFVAQLFAVILPVLDNFNISPAIAGGTEVPIVYLAWVLLYTILYCTIAMLVALLMFEDRDLA